VGVPDLVVYLVRHSNLLVQGTPGKLVFWLSIEPTDCYTPYSIRYYPDSGPQQTAENTVSSHCDLEEILSDP
jgi:hypothetical protein